MRSTLYLAGAAVMSLALTGCGVDLLTSTAIEGELQAQSARTALHALNRTKGAVDRMTAERAVQAYYAERGVYPPSLETLVPNWLPEIPKRADGTPYGYDPKTGQILDTQSMPLQNAPPSRTLSGTQPSAVDQTRLAHLQHAVQAYRNDKGYNPASLYALVPDYLDEVPATTSGAPFIYSMASGAVQLPSTGGDPHQRGVFAAPGPLGEAMTGVGMQQELGRMNNAGTNAAGIYGRQSAQGIADSYSQRQEQALDELGF
jgi:hypothetical protein